MSTKKKRKLGKEELQRIIELCQSIEVKGLSPFLIEVGDLVRIIREYFPQWKDPEELCLDAEALNQIASIITLQSKWVKHRATSLYTDPFLIEDKIHQLNIEEIAQIFLKTWHPIVELEQLSVHSLKGSLNYWEALLPLDERWKKIGFVEKETGAATWEEMIRQNILADESFSTELESFWNELKLKVASEGKIKYWDFVGAETYQETIRRAYMISFLITYGYATLEIHPLEETIYIKPFEKPISTIRKEQLMSVPISISYEEWRRWLENQEA